MTTNDDFQRRIDEEDKHIAEMMQRYPQDEYPDAWICYEGDVYVFDPCWTPDDDDKTDDND